MLVSNQASVDDVIAGFDWVSSVIGREFDAKSARQEPEFRRDRIVALHFLNNHRLEWLFAAARESHRHTGELPRQIKFEPLYTFLVSAHRVFTNLPPTAREEFSAKLKGFVSGQFGIRPFAYELSMATHLMSKGWDVMFADIEKIANFDFLARKDGLEIELECKTTSGDTGRQIHRHEMSRMCSLIEPVLDGLLIEPGSHILHVTLPAKLESSDGALRRLAQVIGGAAQQRKDTRTSGAVVRYAYRSELLWTGPDDDVDIGASLGILNPHVLVRGNRTSVAVAAFTSDRPDAVVETLTRRAKKAADQCSGNRPAIVSLNLIDPIGRSELEKMLGSFNGLHAVAAGIFGSDARRHVDTMAFTVPQNAVIDEAGFTTLKGDVVTLFNPRSRYPSPMIREVFKPHVSENAASMEA